MHRTVTVRVFLFYFISKKNLELFWIRFSSVP